MGRRIATELAPCRSILGLAIFFFACSTPDPTSIRAPQGTPVVLISIDTLRSDHLPIYGYPGVETPALSALARDGIVFEHAFSHVPLTLPSHASVFSGRLPAGHGVRDNVGYLLDGKRIDSGELPYLPKILKGAGYATGGAVSAFVLRKKTGVATGFDFYEDSIEFKTGTGMGGMQREGSATLAAARKWLAGTGDRPFFFFLHLYEPHTPYHPKEPFASRYPLPYDAEIAAADAVVGELLAELKSRGSYDRALVILFSDHGEGLGDHGEDEHGLLLYREALQVPLVVKLPKGELGGKRVATPTQLVDVMPTVLSVLGLAIPQGLAGVSLLSFVDQPVTLRAIYSETFYPRLHFGWSDLASLLDGSFQYIEGPDPELYNLRLDPAQKTNVLLKERRATLELRQVLAGFDRKLVAPGEVDEETKSALAALGYLGSTSVLADGPLPDPKAQVGTLADFKLGIGHQSRKEYPQALAAFERVLVKNPGLIDAWEQLGRTHEKLGRPDEALVAYRKALSLSGGAPQVALNAASIYFGNGQLKEAEEHARLALVAHPSFAHGLLAQIALARKDPTTAEREARAAMDAEGERVGPMITLAAVLHARKAYDEALETIRKAEEAYAGRVAKDPDLLQGLSLIRGKILADLGRAGEARAAFEQEIGLFPQDVRAYANLALLLALSGEPQAAGPTLKRMVDANPSPAAYAEAVKTLRVLEDQAAAKSLLAYARRLFPQSPALRAL